MIVLIFASPVWSVQFHPPYENVIKKLAQWGLKGIELIGWDAAAYRDYYTKERILDLKKLIADLGLQLVNFNYSPGALISENITLRRADEDTYQRAVETACALGSPMLTSVTPYPFSIHK